MHASIDLCLRILQASLVYVNTLMLRDVLGDPKWEAILTHERALHQLDLLLTGTGLRLGSHVERICVTGAAGRLEPETRASLERTYPGDGVVDVDLARVIWSAVFQEQGRSSAITGSSTWVMKHASHLERRGRRETDRPPSARSVRRRAWPQGRSSPSQPGQAYSPAHSFFSTAASSASTMCIGAPRTRLGRALLGRQTCGGPLRVPNR
jgi:hypothetical protein